MCAKKTTNIFLLLLAQLIAFAGFAALADMSQWMVRIPRRATMIVFKFRKILMILGAVSFLAARIANFWTKAVAPWLMRLNELAFVGMFIGGFVAPTFIMFRSKQKGANFIGVKAGERFLNESDEVLTLEVNGDARAYPVKWITQPHIAGDKVGGEEVAMTYCGLSHLGQAFKPELDGRKADLRVMTQLENNLVMYDKVSDRVIQQIYGTTEDGQSHMLQVPTRVMTWGAFREIYPDGKVFFYPEGNPMDKALRSVMFQSIDYQYNRPEPVFPTINHIDRRLFSKEKVYGIHLVNEAVAFTKEFIKAHHSPVNITIGGVPVVLTYNREYDFVDAFDRRIDNKTVEVKEIDVNGNTSAGKLKRIPMACEVLWLIWSNFFPDTKVMTRSQVPELSKR